MKYQIAVVLLSITSSVLSEYLNYWDTKEDSNVDFGWLFDNEDPDNNDVKLEEPQVCETNECKILGKEFLKGINKSVNPCDDFYEFVCGSWGSNNKIPGYCPIWNRPLMFQHTVFRRVKRVLEQKPEKSDILPVRQAKKWYQACMNTADLDKRGIKPLESILIQLGGWPMTIDAEEWDENGHSWQRIEQHYFHLTGSYIFFNVDVTIAEDKSIRIQPEELPLMFKFPTKYRDYRKNKFDEYFRFIRNVVQMFIDLNKANISKKVLKKDAEDMVTFEREIYKIFYRSEFEGGDYETIDEFLQKYKDTVDDKLKKGVTKINFKKLINNKFNMINVKMNTSLPIEGGSLKYYVEMTDLLNKTPKRTIVNYLHWHFVSNMLIYTTEKMRNEMFKYMENQLGITKREPRWLECTKEVKMRAAGGFVFVKNYFTKDTEKIAREMVENIRKEMKSEISKANWLDKETKDLVTEKLKSMKVSLGFPEWYKNKTRVINYYKGLTIGYNHFDNVLSYQKYTIKKKWQEAMADNKNDELEVDPLVVNAFYQFSKNSIVLPAADFQSPLFTSQLPSVVNYGSVGSIIGHEIGHGFDIHGIEFGKDGKHADISKKIMELYYKRAECFLDQFNNYYGVTEPDYEGTTPSIYEGSRGRMTRGENMADTTGLHSVVKAYQNVRRKNPGIISKLPGFEEYTDDQMFFISFGALYCQIGTPKILKIMEEDDSHSPNRLRVIGAVSNTNDFAKAFNCPKGSPMNPKNKCNIWKSKNKHSSFRKNFYDPWMKYL